MMFQERVEGIIGYMRVKESKCEEVEGLSGHCACFFERRGRFRAQPRAGVHWIDRLPDEGDIAYLKR
eukprot:5779383-Alexandrium_andersonii.AAC.1